MTFVVTKGISDWSPTTPPYKKCPSGGPHYPGCWMRMRHVSKRLGGYGCSSRPSPRDRRALIGNAQALIFRVFNNILLRNPVTECSLLTSLYSAFDVFILLFSFTTL